MNIKVLIIGLFFYNFENFLLFESGIVKMRNCIKFYVGFVFYGLKFISAINFL